MVEQRTHNPQVGGSSPPGPTDDAPDSIGIGGFVFIQGARPPWFPGSVWEPVLEALPPMGWQLVHKVVFSMKRLVMVLGSREQKK